MPIYPEIDPKTGVQQRKAGKLVWVVRVHVKGVPRYQRRHYGTRTEIMRQEAKIHEQFLRQAGQLQSAQFLDPTFEEFAKWYIEFKKPSLKEIDTTRRRIRNIIRYRKEFGLQKKKLSEFTTQDVLNFMDWRRKMVLS